MSGAEILVVEDEPAMAAIVVYALREAGYAPHHESSAEAALLATVRQHFDLAVVDVGLPGRDGFTFCREVREREDLPVIILTAHSEADDRIEGFESGADDYVAKPFNRRELILRVRAVLGRSSRTGRSNIHLGVLTINTAAADVLVGSRKVPLTPLEFKLLHVLASNPDIVLTETRLLQEVWGSRHYVGGKNLLKTTVYRLRRAMNRAGLPADLIGTERGRGYVLRAHDVLRVADS